MKINSLIEKTSNISCFRTGLLAAGNDLAQVRLQLNRWEKQKKILKLNKGVYSLSTPYRKSEANPFVIAEGLKRGSYISLQSALALYGHTPEHVPNITSVTTGRPQTINTASGVFVYHHLQALHFWGYVRQQTEDGEDWFIAEREKALFDLVYLISGADKLPFLEELRLQNLNEFDEERLSAYAQKFKSKKINRALCNILAILRAGEGVSV